MNGDKIAIKYVLTRPSTYCLRFERIFYTSLWYVCQSEMAHSRYRLPKTHSCYHYKSKIWFHSSTIKTVPSFVTEYFLHNVVLVKVLDKKIFLKKFLKIKVFVFVLSQFLQWQDNKRKAFPDLHVKFGDIDWLFL